MSDPSVEASRATQAALANPEDVTAQIAAAYACDRNDDEPNAILYYDAAWDLGVPDQERRRFMVGYGSTLRNVGRHAESIAILCQAISESPGYAPNRAFLALSLHSAGDHAEGLATALTALIEAAPEALDGYDRALSEYRDLLVQKH